MSVTGIIALLQVVVANLPGAITTAQQLYDLGVKFFETVNGRAPTADEITALQSNIDSDVMVALQPLPAAQPGDPDYVKDTPPAPEPPAT